MKAVKNEFPNPVLASGRDDFITSCYFYTSGEDKDIKIEKNNITFSLNYSLCCKGLQSLLDAGDAVCVLSVKSGPASFSRLYFFPLNGEKLVVEIPKFDVVERIEITGSIVAARKIDNYECPGEFNELYFANNTFEIRKGDILATEDTRIVFLDGSELEKPISSIFEIEERNEIPASICPMYDDQKIKIYLKEDLFRLYKEYIGFNNGALRRYATGVIVYPVLVEAVGYVLAHHQQESEGSDYESYRWFRAIEKKAEDNGINFDETEETSVSIADKLLGSVSLDALKSFYDTLGSEMDNGETEMIGGID